MKYLDYIIAFNLGACSTNLLISFMAPNADQIGGYPPLIGLIGGITYSASRFAETWISANSPEMKRGPE